MTAGSALAEHIAALRLVDNHVHGFWLSAGDRRRFENGLNEANTDPLADFDSGFDTQLGFAVRAHCAPLLGLPGHVDPQRYWERRSGVSEPDLARVFLPAAGVSDWLVDTGLPGDVTLLQTKRASSVCNGVPRSRHKEQCMQRLMAAVVVLTLFLSAGRVAFAAEAAEAPLDQAPEIKPFSSAHFGLAGTVKMDGITVDILGEGDLGVPDRQKSAFKFGPLTAEVVMVGDTVFTRTRFEPRWSRQTSPQVVAVGPISSSDVTRLGRDVKLIGTETVDGVATQHYTSSLDLSPLIEPLLIRLPAVCSTPAKAVPRPAPTAALTARKRSSFGHPRPISRKPLAGVIASSGSSLLHRVPPVSPSALVGD